MLTIRTLTPGVIRDGIGRIGIGVGGVVVPTASFGMRLGLLLDLEGFFVAVSARAVVTPTAVGVVGGGRGRERRRGRHE